VLQLDFEHANPRALRCRIVGERIIAEGPGVSFAPEAIHEGVDVLDVRTPLNSAGEKPTSSRKTLEERIVKPRLISRVRFFQISVGGRPIFVLPRTKSTLGTRSAQSRESRCMRIIRRAHLIRNPRRLCIACQIQRELEITRAAPDVQAGGCTSLQVGRR